VDGIRRVSQPSHSRGRRFNPCTAHHINQLLLQITQKWLRTFLRKFVFYPILLPLLPPSQQLTLANNGESWQIENKTLWHNPCINFFCD
jgi:hypothetical protein